jgi:predicted nucleic acid-binding protein
VIRAFVADASVAVGWVHPAQATSETEATLDAIAEGAILEVPALWPLEVANALTVLVRRRKLTQDERETALGWLRILPLRVDHEMSSLPFPGFLSWPPLITCRSTTPRTWNWHSDGSSF